MKGTIGIIGGKGKFGRWFFEFFERFPLFSEQSILISDLSTDLSPLELAQRSDVILVSVPISVASKVIEDIEPALTQDRLLVEITSVKTHLTPSLSKVKADVLSLHPMFAPSVEIAGQRVTHYHFLNSGSGKAERYARGVLTSFEKAGALLVPITPEEHDKAMAIIQGLTHLSAIATARALQKLGADSSSLALLASPVYRIRMATAGRILAHDPRLYGEIAMVNPFVEESVGAFLGALEELSECLKTQDLDSFSQLFQEAACHMGSFLEDAQEESDFLIHALASRGKRE